MNKKLYILITLLLVITILAFFLVPRPIAKEGYIHRGIEDMFYSEDITLNASGKITGFSDSNKLTCISFDEKNSHMYEVITLTTVMRIKFKGTYRPFGFSNLAGSAMCAKVKVTEVIDFEVISK